MSVPAPCMHAAELIPWLVNGTLPGPQAAELEAHLEACASCRQDFDAQHRLCAAMRAPDSLAFAAEPSFQKLLDRIDAAEPQRPVSSAERQPTSAPARARDVPRRPAPSALTRWLIAAVLLQAMGLGAGAWLWHARGTPAPGAAYVTLTAPAAPWSAERIRVLFHQEVSLDELARLLHGIDARVIDGPTQDNVYTLGFRGAAGDSAQRDARLAALRASPAVLFAEPLSREAD